ncbi:MAG: extensin family protein [Beijerinckiaceae bacterium]
MMLRRVCSVLGVFVVVGLSATGCSRYQKEQRAEWRSAAEKACLRSGVVKETAHVRIAKALEGPGTCGADHPIKVTAFTMDNMDITASSPGLFSPRPNLLTKLNNEGTFTCPMYAAVDRWLEQVVQPAAMKRFGQPVVELRTMGSYNCRPMNNTRGNRLSEHSFANAIDVGGFRLQDGSIITILKGWKGGLEEQNFLREVHAGACKNFATVLGPGADAFHYDHFHFDLARHGRRGDRSICRPYPQPVTPANEGFPQDPGRGSMMSDGRGVVPGQPQSQAYASAPVLPAYRPAQLPPTPRNPVAEQERDELVRDAQPRDPRYPQVRDVPVRDPQRAQPPQQNRQPQAPVLLYGKGQGPFLPLEEHEIDPNDLDPVTGSIGE